MKILILVASCRTPPYDALERAQRETWDSVSVPGVETHFYHCTDLESMIPCFLEATEPSFEWDHDFIFRTNSSSYVDKARLLEHAETLPRERCYQGVDGDGFASGSGFFISPDVEEMLRLNSSGRYHDEAPLLTIARANPELIEDVAIGLCLARRGVTVTPGARREDYWLLHFQSQFYGLPLDEKILDAYHVRCKGDGIDRTKDVEAMRAVHEIKIGAR